MRRQYRLILRDSLVFSLRPDPFINSLLKNILLAYIQLKTGKGLLKSFQYTIDKASNNKCFCSAARRQDTKHLLLECQQYKKERAEMKKQLKNVPLGLNVLFCITKGCKALARFIEQTGVCTMGWQRERIEEVE